MPEIVLIMRQPGNARVLRQALEEHGYNCSNVDSSESLQAVLRQTAMPVLALVDVSGFGKAIWLMCEHLQQADVPFIVLSAKRELEICTKTLGYGATRILEKPVVKASLLKLIEGIAQLRTI